MPRIYDHIDLRARSLAAVTPFYERLLPALGFTRRVEVPDWLQFESETSADDLGGTAFFGVTESRGHEPNENRIAFRVESQSEVDRIAAIAEEAGATAMELPALHAPGYYAAFFGDPCGNRLEICHRVR